MDYEVVLLIITIVGIFLAFLSKFLEYVSKDKETHGL